MSDFESITDKATDYVLDELPPAERDEFETLLEQSPELRAHVRDLEEGALALATAAPAALPPKNAWTEIQRVIARDQSRQRARNIVTAIFKNGWAAAAACLVGWLIYALSSDRSPSGPSKHDSIASTSTAENSGSAVHVRPGVRSNLIAVVTARTNLLASTSTNHEAIAFRNQLSNLQQQLAHLSTSLTQHQAALNEPSRLKFLQLAPTSGVDKAVLSPAAQRAFFYALARELGWLSSTNNEGNFNFQIGPEDFGQTNGLNMDFVDLRTNGTANPVRLRVPGATDVVQTSDPGATTPAGAETPSMQRPIMAASSAPSTVIPAFATGSTLFFAVDPAMALPDTQIVVTAASGGDQTQDIIGTSDLSDVPLVVATRWNSVDGSSITVTFQTTTGNSNVTYSVFTPTPNP
jgi:hypothetical protein